MGVPKRKTSRSKLRSRRMAKRWKAPQLATDKETGTRYLPHRVNPKTGLYKGRQVTTVEAAS